MSHYAKWLCFYLITYFNDMYVFFLFFCFFVFLFFCFCFFVFVFFVNIYIVSILGDLSGMESSTILQIILMACLF